MVQIVTPGLEAVRFTGWHATGLVFMLVFCCVNGAAAVYGSDADIPVDRVYRTPSQHVVPLDSLGTKFAFYPQFSAYPNEQLLNPHKLAATMNSNDPLVVFPQFIGALLPNQPIKWKGMCFQNNSAVLASVSRSGATVAFEMGSPRSNLCSEQLFMATSEGYYVHPIFRHGHHEFVIKTWRNDDEYTDVVQNGVRVFIFDASILGVVVDTVEFAMMFTGPWTESQTMSFFKKTMQWEFQKRSNPTAYHIDEKLVHSGDLLIMLEFTGLHGLICFGTGGHVGHAATALWMDGSLYVVEITMDSNSSRNGVIRTPFKEWVDFKQAHGAQVVLVPLAPEARARFDEKKAVAFYKKTAGWPYGLHNFVFGWVDTVDASLPAPLNWNSLAVGLILGSGMLPSKIDSMFGEGMRQRLQHYYNFGAAALPKSMPDLLAFLGARNITLADLCILPEKDEWIYSEGVNSMVCSVYVTTMYREAGVFGSGASLVPFSATELSPRDLYSLKIYATTWADQPAECLRDGAITPTPTCQLTGRYQVTLPGLNEIEPFPHMFEKCGALPPVYARSPAHC